MFAKWSIHQIKPELLSGTACGSDHVLLTKPTGLQLFGSRSIQSWADLVTQTRTHTQSLNFNVMASTSWYAYTVTWWNRWRSTCTIWERREPTTQHARLTATDGNCVWELSDQTTTLYIIATKAIDIYGVEIHWNSLDARSVQILVNWQTGQIRDGNLLMHGVSRVPRGGGKLMQPFSLMFRLSDSWKKQSINQNWIDFRIPLYWYREIGVPFQTSILHARSPGNSNILHKISGQLMSCWVHRWIQENFESWGQPIEVEVGPSGWANGQVVDSERHEFLHASVSQKVSSPLPDKASGSPASGSPTVSRTTVRDVPVWIVVCSAIGFLLWNTDQNGSWTLWTGKCFRKTWISAYLSQKASPLPHSNVSGSPMPSPTTVRDVPV